MIWFILVVVFFIALYIASKVYQIKNGKETIECRECHFLITRDDLARKRACPRCGHTYFIEVGQHDNRN